MKPVIRFKLVGTLAAACVVAACSYNRPSIPVVAVRGDLTALVGSWSGEYQSTRAERSGTITFNLAAGADSAFGDVLMIPRVNSDGPQFDLRAGVPQRLPRPLAITFVRLRDNDVSGLLDAYVDPDIGCLVETRFRGTFQGADRLEGTFITRDEQGHVLQRGTWKVKRG